MRTVHRIRPRRMPSRRRLVNTIGGDSSSGDEHSSVARDLHVREAFVWRLPTQTRRSGSRATIRIFVDESGNFIVGGVPLEGGRRGVHPW